MVPELVERGGYRSGILINSKSLRKKNLALEELLTYQTNHKAALLAQEHTLAKVLNKEGARG